MSTSQETLSALAKTMPKTMIANEQMLVRFEKSKAMRALGLNPYRNGVKPNALAAELHTRYEHVSREELESLKPQVTVSGRVMAIRDFGKGGFVRIQDRTGLIQVFVSKDSLAAQFDHYKNFTDISDIIYIEGHVFRTKTNELSVHATQFVVLTKSLRPLPEKFHGLSDVELRYRNRSVDLIMNPAVRDTFRARTKIISYIRNFFDQRDFLEVDTPMLHQIAGGAAAKPFMTHHNALDLELSLRIAPELHLKRLIVGGFERVYELNRQFRNEGISIKHNPEFSSIEFYWAYATYEDLMSLTEELFQGLAQTVKGSLEISYQGTNISFAGPWQRLTVKESILKLSGFADYAAKSGSLPALEALHDQSVVRGYLDSKKFHYDESQTLGHDWMSIFDNEVEAQLIQPTFITQYPTSVSPLSRRNDVDPSVVDRFELFIFGREVANAFSELNDPVDQRIRFEQQADETARGNEEACDIDEDFLAALEQGMPPTAGQGIGIDRLVMLFTDSASIRDVILFPQMKPRSHHVGLEHESTNES